MKKCSQCGRVYSDLVNTCSYCGTPLNGGATSSSAPKPPVRQTYTPPVQPSKPPVQRQTPPSQNQTPPAKTTYTPPVAQATENVGKGVLGAFLFAVGGLILQIVLINVNIIAGLAGIATYFLAITGYQKFSGIGSGDSKKAVWICIPISLLMIFLGTFMGYGIYVGKLLGIPASEALREIQMNQELMDAVMADAGKTVAFWGVSVVYILIRSKKKK